MGVRGKAAEAMSKRELGGANSGGEESRQEGGRIERDR